MTPPLTRIAACVFAGLLLAGCGQSASTGTTSSAIAAPSTGYTLGPCNSLPSVTGAKSSAQWLNAAAPQIVDPNLVGADVAASAALPGARFVFVFGDTARVADGGATLAVRNSMEIIAGTCAYVVGAPGNRAVVPDRTDGVGYWPMSVLVNPATGPVTQFTVMMQRVRATGELEFENLGPAVAVFSVGTDGSPQLDSVTDVGPDAASRSHPCWGAATYSATDGYWYLYGTSSPSKPGVFGWAVKVARVPAGKAADLATWQYWDGKSWSSSESSAMDLIPAEDGVSQTFSVFSRQGRLYAVSKKGGYLGDDLAIWPMKSPTGPMESPVTVGLIPNTTNPEQLLYMPLAHPDLPASKPSQILVSVSRNTTDAALLAHSPLLYRPFFVEVELPPVASTKNLTPPKVPVGIPSASSS